MIRFLARHSLEPIAVVHDIGTCGRTHTLRRLAAGEGFDQERPVTDLAYPFAMEGNPSCGYICSSGAFSCHPFSSQIEESQTIAGRGLVSPGRVGTPFSRATADSSARAHRLPYIRKAANRAADMCFPAVFRPPIVPSAACSGLEMARRRHFLAQRDGACERARQRNRCAVFLYWARA